MLFSPCNKCLVKVICKDEYNCHPLHKYSELLGMIGSIILCSSVLFVLLLGAIELIIPNTITAFQFMLLVLTYLFLAMIIFVYCTHDVKTRSITK